MKSPLNWYGGKYNMINKIAPIIERVPHQTYVEVFGGAGHLIFAKKPSPIDVYNDIHSGLVDFFKILREQPEELQRVLSLTPYSREEFERCKDWFLVNDDLERVRQFYVSIMQSYATKGGTWSYNKTLSRRGVSAVVSKWLSKIDLLEPTVNRAKTLQIENLDFQDLIERYDTKETLFYLDPPYLPETRNAKKVYKHEMTYEDHERLVDVLGKIKGKAILSNYDNELYDQLNWDKVSIGEYTLLAKKANVGETKNKKEEFLWMKI